MVGSTVPHGGSVLPGFLALLMAGGLSQTDEARPDTERQSRVAIAAAMREERGYELRVTTNQSRFQTRVLLRLARAARSARHGAGVLFIDYEDWFRAYLEAVDLREDEAPLSVRLSYENQFDIIADARTEAVVERVLAGERPSQALNVVWRSRRGTRYSYRDMHSHPVLEVTFEQIVSYRLLEVDSVVVEDEFRGVSGRPATGALGLLFRLIGKAHPVWSRSAVSSDGWQVIVGKVRKGPFSRTGTVTVQPDGSSEPGVPPGRSDLAALERRLRQPMAIVYYPWTRN
jgi:hypothetical protein